MFDLVKKQTPPLLAILLLVQSVRTKYFALRYFLILWKCNAFMVCATETVNAVSLTCSNKRDRHLFGSRTWTLLAKNVVVDLLLQSCYT